MKLPTFEDFIDDLGSPTRAPTLDEDTAWGHFGGLTIEEAFKRLVDHPDFYQEDFMNMGGRAFAFYFPVVERYVREVEAQNDFADESWILAYDIALHIPGEQGVMTPLYERIIDLCRFVIEGIKNINPSSDLERTWPPDKVEEAWTELLEKTLTALGQ